MQKRYREFFKTERERLKRTQPDVARRGGATQGTISKIETDPAYEPSITNFERALAGIDHTILSFFGQVDGSEASDSVGHTKDSNVRLLTAGVSEHNATPKIAGVVDATAAAIHESDAAALDRIRFALREAGTILLEAGINDDADRPAPKTSSRATHTPPARHRVRAASTRK